MSARWWFALALHLLISLSSLPAPAGGSTLVPSVGGVTNTGCIALEQSLDCQQIGLNFWASGVRERFTQAVLDRNLDGTVTEGELQDFDITGDQLHQVDGGIAVAVLVTDDSPLRFITDKGAFNYDASASSAEFVCNQAPTVFGFDDLTRDEDCDGDGTMGDGIVYGHLRSDGAALGPGTVTITHATTGDPVGTYGFTIVGEPVFIELFTGDNLAEDGLRVDEACEDSPQRDNARYAIVSRDAGGQPVTGAWIKWTVLNPFQLAVEHYYTPTLDQGDGFYTLNTVCGIAWGPYPGFTGPNLQIGLTKGPGLDPPAEGELTFDPAAGQYSLGQSVGVADCDDDADRMCDTFEDWRGCLDSAIPDAFGDPDDDTLQSLGEYVYFLNPCDPDTDGDGCHEDQELGTESTLGGDRDPTYFWDFFDVTGDRSIDLADTLAILGRFGAVPGDANYDPLFDRSGDWRYNVAYRTREADLPAGIDLADALLNLQSFGHSCVVPD